MRVSRKLLGSLRLMGVLVVLLLTSCRSSSARLGAALSAACQAVELCEPVFEAPELIELLLDRPSPMTTPDHVGSTLDQLLPRMARRPGSQVRLWATTAHDGEVELLSEVHSPDPQSDRHRSTKLEREEWQHTARARLMARVAPALAAPPATRSSLAAALARLALRTEDGRATQLIVVADGYDTSLGGFACDTVSVSDELVGSLPLRRWLPDGLLTRVTVHLTYFAPVAPDGCPVNALRFGILQSVWGQLLMGAGAKEVLIEGGPVHFTDEAFAFSQQNGWKWWLPHGESP